MKSHYEHIYLHNNEIKFFGYPVESAKGKFQTKGEINNMKILWGILMIMVGIFMLISSFKKSDFIIYRLLVARSRILWGENVHRFYQVVGVIIIVFGILMTVGIIGK